MFINLTEKKLGKPLFINTEHISCYYQLTEYKQNKYSDVFNIAEELMKGSRVELSNGKEYDVKESINEIKNKINDFKKIKL